nr:Ger(x)C family spore germination protein [Paenibacillus contaminans]
MGACLSLGCLSGCWSTVELNDRSFAKILLVDKTEAGIELTLGFPLPNQLVPNQAGGGGGGKTDYPFSYVTKTDKEIAKAYRAIQSDLSRKIAFGQLEIIIIGRRLAEDGIGPVVDFIAREPKLHINSYLFVLDGSLKEFANIPVGFERFPVDILTAYAEEQVTVEVTLKDLLMANYSGGDLVIPTIVFDREGMVKKKKGEKWLGTDGAAILRNGRMVSKLNTKEMRGALWILGKLQDAEVNVTSPTDGKTISFLVTNATTRINPETGSPLKIHINCKADVDVLANESDMTLDTPDQLRILERSLGEKLEKRIAQAVAVSKEAKADAFQLGNYIRWYYPRKWKEMKKDWRQLYADHIIVDQHVDVAIKRLGAARKPEGQRLHAGKEE